MDAGGDATESKEHFVLVHGAGHGACRVDPCSVRSFDEYTAPLVGLLSALPDGEKGVPDLSELGDVYDLAFGLGMDHPPTSVALQPEFQRMILSQQSPREDSALASILLRPWPAALSAARFGRGGGDSSTIDQVLRVYITTAKDCMVKPEQQEAMIRRWPPSKVVAMDTDHSPFFSAPERLFQLIVKLL
ncbi:unnamed protein product [Triticum turgidum subsp. durum]|uniref:AB hydrolase-1 domain-containing protein n=1 Tax=Triticum turgidum subsp. durum TaxID=4567 RepID=A0A9R0SYH2_TRITD|nr:unnamed protein product [Triticum turgidum subsp. durum]